MFYFSIPNNFQYAGLAIDSRQRAPRTVMVNDPILTSFNPMITACTSAEFYDLGLRSD